MIEQLAGWTFRLRWWWLLSLAVVVSGLWWVTPDIEFDQTVEAFFPPGHPALVSYQRSKDSFGGDHLVYVAYDDPQLWTMAGMDRVRTLADRISKDVPGVVRVDALDRMPVPWKVDAAVEAMNEKSFSFRRIARMIAGRTDVRMLVKFLEDEPERLATNRQRICSHPLYNGLVVDAEGTMTALIVKIDDPEKTDQRRTVTELRRVADSFAVDAGIERVAVAGPPVLVVDGFVSLDKDNRTLGLVAMCLMAVTMLVAVRNPAWALLPLFAGWSTWQLVRATICWFDLKLTLSSGPIIATTVVLCMPAAAHLAVRFRESMLRGESRDDAAVATLRNVFIPIAWCAATAAVGYLATSIATSVQPVFQQGITMFVCNLAAGIITFLLAASAMGFARRPKNHSAAARTPTDSGSGFVARQIGYLTERILARPKTALAAFILPIVVLSFGARSLEFESNYINIYKPHARVTSDYRFVEDRMGGIGLVELVFPAPDEVNPAWIDQLHDSAEALKATDPELVSGVVSLSDVLSLPPVDSTDEDNNETEAKGESVLSARDEYLATKLRLLGRDSYVHVLDNFWNRTDNSMRLLCRVRESAEADRKETCFQSLLASAHSTLSEQTIITGLSHLMTQITSAVIVTAFQSATWATLMIGLMLCLALRSLRLAVLAMVPTMLSVGLVLGVMGWLGLKIDMSTALVASVAIGLSVDDTFHCLLRWKQEVAGGRSRDEALRVAYTGSGPGVVLSSTAVSLGFMAMIVSEFVPTSNFAWLVSVATLGGSLGNLVVLPATLAVFRGRTTKPATAVSTSPLVQTGHHTDEFGDT